MSDELRKAARELLDALSDVWVEERIGGAASRECRAESALRAALSTPEPSREVTPDMFWDADDAEHTASHSIEDLLELVADDMRDGDGHREIEVMCGMSLPNITIKVWVEGDELKWEEIDAAIAKDPKS